jgi:FixJ family two-component response regulator
MLRARGYATEGVESGSDLFRRLSSATNPPSVILLDVNLPDADGIEVIGKLRALGVRVPVIMLSGTGRVRTVVEAMKLGALDFLMKPFTDTALENAIRTAFEDGV